MWNAFAKIVANDATGNAAGVAALLMVFVIVVACLTVYHVTDLITRRWK